MRRGRHGGIHTLRVIILHSWQSDNLGNKIITFIIIITDLASNAEQKEHEEEQCGPHWRQRHEAQRPGISHKCQSRTYTEKKQLVNSFHSRCQSEYIAITYGTYLLSCFIADIPFNSSLIKIS